MRLSLAGVLLFSILLSGCSVGMAMHGKKDPELGAVRVGATRGEIELHLGYPVEIRHEGDTRVNVYSYEIGNEPSAGRAIGHGVMDVLTLGLWEVIGTPVEAVQGDKKYLTIVYDDNDVVTRVGSIAPPAKPTEKKTTESQN